MGKEKGSSSNSGAKHKGMEAKKHFSQNPGDTHPKLDDVPSTAGARAFISSSSSSNQPKPRTLRRKQERFDQSANRRTTDIERRLAAKERAAAARGTGAAGMLAESLGDSSTKIMVAFLLFVVVGSALLQIFRS